MSDYISPESQRLIIEKLYRSDDSITSTKKYNKNYGDNMGIRSMTLYDFAKKMKRSSFLSYDVERFTKDVTGKTIDLERL